MAMLQVECIQDTSSFLRLGPEWQELWQRSTPRSYFLTHDWIRCCWEELQSTNGLRIFVVRDNGKAALIAPCMRSRRVHKRLPVTCLTFIDHPETQVADVIVSDSGNGAEALAAWIRHLSEERSTEWNLLSLDKLSSSSQTLEWLARVRGAPGCYCELQPSHEALVISLNGTWEAYLGAKSTRFRKTLRNIANRILRLGPVEIESFTGHEAAKQAIPKLFSVSEASWKVSGGVAITSSAERMRFFEEVSRGLATAEGLRIVILSVNGQAIASETQVLFGQTIYALRSDYDERYADSSPGTYLQMEILKEAFGGSYKEYNFGVGLNPYKTRWTEERCQLMRFRLYNHTLYGRLLHAVSRVEPKLLRVPGIRLLNNVWAAKFS